MRSERLRRTAAVAALKTPDGESIAARVGIATGLVVVGQIIDEQEARELASRHLKGFVEPVRAWNVVGERAAESR